MGREPNDGQAKERFNKVWDEVGASKLWAGQLGDYVKGVAWREVSNYWRYENRCIRKSRRDKLVEFIVRELTNVGPIEVGEIKVVVKSIVAKAVKEA